MKIKQIVAAGPRLYALTEDGAVWARDDDGACRWGKECEAPDPLEEERVQIVSVACTARHSHGEDSDQFYLYGLDAEGRLYEYDDGCYGRRFAGWYLEEQPG